MAFIRLRAGGRNKARQLLDKIGSIDPEDSLGAGVVGALADAASPRPRGSRARR